MRSVNILIGDHFGFLNGWVFSCKEETQDYFLKTKNKIFINMVLNYGNFVSFMEWIDGHVGVCSKYEPIKLRNISIPNQQVLLKGVLTKPADFWHDPLKFSLYLSLCRCGKNFDGKNHIQALMSDIHVNRTINHVIDFLNGKTDVMPKNNTMIFNSSKGWYYWMCSKVNDLVLYNKQQELYLLFKRCPYLTHHGDFFIINRIRSFIKFILGKDYNSNVNWERFITNNEFFIYKNKKYTFAKNSYRKVYNIFYKQSRNELVKI